MMPDNKNINNKLLITIIVIMAGFMATMIGTSYSSIKESSKSASDICDEREKERLDDHDGIIILKGSIENIKENIEKILIELKELRDKK